MGARASFWAIGCRSFSSKPLAEQRASHESHFGHRWNAPKYIYHVHWMVGKGISGWEKIMHNGFKLGQIPDKFSTVNFACQPQDLTLSIRGAAARGDGIACVSSLLERSSNPATSAHRAENK